MKTKLFLSIVLMWLILASCNYSEPKYSCDESVDAWIKDHITDVRKMTRSGWLNSDERFSIPMYRAFTPEQRINFWREKFIEIKKLSWTDAELKHICKLESFFENHLNLFKVDKVSDEELDEVDVYLYKWRTLANEEFGWTDQTVNSIVASGKKVLDTKGNLQSMTKSTAKDGFTKDSESCNCHVKSVFTCGMHEACEDAVCSESSIGCGGFFLWSCDGRCEEPN